MSVRPATAPRDVVGRIGSDLRQIPSALGRVPTAAWICALIACLNAVCWSLITPAFQVNDEPAHFAYVQQLAETGSLPGSGNNEFSEEEEVARRDLRQLEVRWHPEVQGVSTAAEQNRLEHDLAMALARASPGGSAGVAFGQPPLYYALQTIPYALGSSGSLLDRLALMRLFSALMAGLTALFCWLFIREVLPAVPWAWTVGGLGIALMPLLGFISGALNPDAMLFAVCAAVFYALARAFRRGLTLRLALAIGLLGALGTLTKLNFLGLLPGVILGLIVLAVRAAKSSKAGAYRALGLGLALALAPIGLYVVINLFSNHAGLGAASSGINLTTGHGSLGGELSYIWQFYLPRLPGMATDFPGLSPIHQIWFDRSVGLYGWLDTSFPVWVENLALIPAALLTILGIRALVTLRATLRRRLLELAVYAVMGLGVLILIGGDSYLGFPAQAGTYGEPRYLLPMLPLIGAGLALSARGAGRRWGPAVGTLIVVLLLAHNIFSQLQVIARFFG
jgi:4-amino-4-deoxy-L-arabinose transferase-like glycosyltransferase